MIKNFLASIIALTIGSPFTQASNPITLEVDPGRSVKTITYIESNSNHPRELGCVTLAVKGKLFGVIGSQSILEIPGKEGCLKFSEEEFKQHASSCRDGYSYQRWTTIFKDEKGYLYYPEHYPEMIVTTRNKVSSVTKTPLELLTEIGVNELEGLVKKDHINNIYYEFLNYVNETAGIYFRLYPVLPIAISAATTTAEGKSIASTM